MKSTKALATAALVILALGSIAPELVSGQTYQGQGRWREGRWQRARANGYRSQVMVPAGTSFNVRLDSKISTDNANSGDTWVGTVTQSVISNNQVMIPAGSPVQGVVTNNVQGTHNERPQLALGVQRVTVNGRSYSMNADTEPIVAGTNRAKKLGAIAGGAAVGALLGHTVAKDNHGTLIGGLLGGAAGYGASRHALRTMQLKPGTVLTFTTQEDMMAVRR